MSDLEARAFDLFDEYVELTPRQRADALAALRAREPALHDALQRLLQADAASYPLDGGALDALYAEHAGSDGGGIDPSSLARVGTLLGPWHIDRVLAQGGMGTVYEASRADGQYEKKVALKCIRAEMSSPVLVDAFMRERNHLAKLDHPNIAPLLDGGVEGDGRPWFAMRLVRGVSVDQWADQQRLDLASRVSLLLQASRALQYAHAHGVLHQDIKPGNLLVSPDGVVHLVDFGLSTLMSGREGDPSAPIAVSDGYTAPELLTGGAASVAADVHAMGVVLYQLLVDAWPRPLQPLHTQLTGIGARSAHAPSMLAATALPQVAYLRQCRDTRMLRRKLQGDLDAIALKCVALAPGDRYASVGALIEDLECWLSRRPVGARGAGRAYVLGRFFRRNALPTLLAGSVMLTMAAAAGAFAWLHWRDQQEARDMQLVSTMFEQTLGAATLSGLAEARPSSRQLLEKTEAHLRALPPQSSPVIRARALTSLARSYAVLGDYAHALSLASQANRLLTDSPAHQSETQATLATLLNLQARHAEARDVATQSLRQSTSVRPTADSTTLNLLTELARAHWGLTEHDAAFDALGFAQNVAAGLRSQPALDTQVELSILRAQWHLQLMDLVEAGRELDAATALAREASPSLADNVNEARLSLLLLKEDHGQARQVAEALLASRRQRLGLEHPDTARSSRLRLEVLERQAEADIPPSALRETHGAILTAYGTAHPEYARQLLLEARLQRRHDVSKSVSLSGEAVQLLERILGPRHPTTLAAKEEQAQTLIQLASAQSGPSQEASLTHAISMLQEVVHATRQRQQPSPSAKYLLAQALLLRAANGTPDAATDLRRAEALLQDALVEASRQLGPRHAVTVRIRNALVGNFLPASRSAQAGVPAAARR
ncbi:serine/threonine-protein kinase [Pseudoxanthomonas sp. 3HH-4]|uniref:serine/threonine-protein kinase n=1 Tax=Pseudoxanthomonas sp. 3HH-4 TaxID=1690214 RepID=UPI00114DD7A3|nr:serine/threonine-protein kinase [Pseudoxanthomonas sp. 3HH-4]TQM16697.1 serine/threonine-protein kinase [Pseudoxanthomonas sp. 3HH-4]